MPHPAVIAAPMTTNNPIPTPRRAAPISASAFTFSLGKKSRATPLPHPIAAPVAVHSSTSSTAPIELARPPSEQTPTPARRKDSTVIATPIAGTPLRSILDIRTPHRPYSPSNEPILHTGSDESPKPKREEVESTPKKVSIIKPLNAFQTPDKRAGGGDWGGNSSGRKVASSAFSLNVPSRPLVEDDGRPKIPLQAITLAKSERVADDLLRRRKRELLEGDSENEGIGVSPRGKKIMTWTGRGAIPPSVRLANLLSSTNASLQLFHTAMEYTLYPSHKGQNRSTLARPHSTTSDTATATATATVPPTLFQYIHSAPIRLRLKSHVKGATHHSVYFHCELLTSTSTSSEVTLGEEVLVAFQTMPPECPRLGLDPRLLVHKIGTGTDEKNWQVGIWAWTEVDIPFSNSDSGEEEEGAEDGNEMVKTILATRYLVVEEVQVVN